MAGPVTGRGHATVARLQAARRMSRLVFSVPQPPWWLQPYVSLATDPSTVRHAYSAQVEWDAALFKYLLVSLLCPLLPQEVCK